MDRPMSNHQQGTRNTDMPAHQRLNLLHLFGIDPRNTEIPHFTRHTHPTTGEGSHSSWQMCLDNHCPWITMDADQRRTIPRQPGSGWTPFQQEELVTWMDTDTTPEETTPEEATPEETTPTSAATGEEIPTDTGATTKTTRRRRTTAKN